MRRIDANQPIDKVDRSDLFRARLIDFGAVDRRYVLADTGFRALAIFTVESLIAFLLIGLAAGWLASVLLRRRNMGLLAYLIVGVVGAVLGAVILGLLGIQFHGLVGGFIAAVVGALVLLVLLRLVR